MPGRNLLNGSDIIRKAGRADGAMYPFTFDRIRDNIQAECVLTICA